jgi:quinol monooxygenase YgiN
MKFFLIGISLYLAASTAFATARLRTQKQCPVIVIALVKVKPGTEERFKKHALSILKPTRAEKGNKFYNFNQSLTDSTVFDTYEEWENMEAFEAHLTMSHMEVFFSQVGQLFESGYPVIHTLKNIECNKSPTKSDYVN